MTKHTIGFFGDSFCHWRNIWEKHTYIDMVADSLDLEVVNLGIPGSSIEDAILLQFGEFEKNLNIPDICVFCWTDTHRLYNNIVRNINGFTIDKYKKDKSSTMIEQKIIDAAQRYYSFLYDRDWHELRHTSMIYYFNNVLLDKYPNTKIINLWSLAHIKNYTTDSRKDFTPENEKYPLRFNRGIEIRPSLMSLSMIDPDCPDDLEKERRCNHLGHQSVNRFLADTIIDAIKNYESGKLITMDFGKLK